MSRTIRFHQFGPAEVLKLEEQPVASPAPGEVQVRVQAIGVSWYDVLWRQNLASTQARLPAGLGYEMAGVVSALGDGVDDLQVGDKVASFPAADANQHPVYGECIVMPRLALTRYPDVLTPVEASVHYTPYLVAYFAYVDLARIKTGQTVLVTDASHCSGPAFVQLGKALGVRVIAATKTEDAREYLLSLGADKVVVTEEQDLLMAINKYTATAASMRFSMASVARRCRLWVMCSRHAAVWCCMACKAAIRRRSRPAQPFRRTFSFTCTAWAISPANRNWASLRISRRCSVRCRTSTR